MFIYVKLNTIDLKMFMEAQKVNTKFDYIKKF